MTKLFLLFTIVFACLCANVFSQNNDALLSSTDFKFVVSNIFRIEISRDSYVDETVVAYYADASDDFDAYDSEKMFSSDSNFPQIYTLTTDNVIVAIDGISEIATGEDRIIPLGFVTYVAGSFTFNATNLIDFDATIPVHLEDLLLSTTQDLRTNSSYTFSSGIVNDADRFRLHFGTTSTDIASNEGSVASAYVLENTIYINTPESGSTIDFFDILGNKIFSLQSAAGLNILQPGISAGIYIIKIQNGNNIVSQKVFIQ